MQKSSWYKKRSNWIRFIISIIFTYLVTFYPVAFFVRSPSQVEEAFFKILSLIYLPITLVWIYVENWTGIDQIPSYSFFGLYLSWLYFIIIFFYTLLIIWTAESVISYIRQVIAKKQVKPKRSTIVALVLVFIIFSSAWHGNDLFEDQYFEKNGIIYYGSRLPGKHISVVENVDDNTFQSLDCEYGKDENSVFWKGKIVEADPETFTVLSCGYTKDLNHVFFNRVFLELADPETFEIVGDGEKYGKDKDRVFWLNYVLDEADPETFEVIIPEQEKAHARDGNYIFVNGSIYHTYECTYRSSLPCSSQ